MATETSQLNERFRVVTDIRPIDTISAAQTGAWISVKNHRRILAIIAQGAQAGGTPAVTFQQAKDAAGTGAKALNFDTRFTSTALVNDVPVKTAVVANTFNLTVANQVHLVEFRQSDFDINNGYGYIQCNIATPGANSVLVSVSFALGDTHYPGNPTLATSLIV